MWLSQYKVKSTIWRYSALSREACLRSYSTQYYWLRSNCVWLVGTSKAILEWVDLLSRQPNLDYYSKSMTDSPRTIFSVKKPSPISAVIADRLADMWPHRVGGRGGVYSEECVLFPVLLTGFIYNVVWLFKGLTQHILLILLRVHTE